MKKKFEFCPKCKSTNIQTDFENIVALSIGTPMKMCTNCGYINKSFPITDKKPKQISITKNNNETDIQTGYNFERLSLVIFSCVLLFTAVVCLLFKFWLVSGLLFIFSGLLVWLAQLLKIKKDN